MKHMLLYFICTADMARKRSGSSSFSRAAKFLQSMSQYTTTKCGDTPRTTSSLLARAKLALTEMESVFFARAADWRSPCLAAFTNRHNVSSR